VVYNEPREVYDGRVRPNAKETCMTPSNPKNLSTSEIIRNAEEAVRTLYAAGQSVSDQLWRLGDITVTIAGPDQGTGDHRNPDIEALGQEIGVDYGDLMRCRSVSTAWPPEQRFTGATWATHRDLAGYDDREVKMKDVLAGTGKRPGFGISHLFGRTEKTGRTPLP
jgi:hypothetical protein